MSPTREPRIAIVGGGVGALACARTLQRHGRAVTVFEREASYDSRWQGGMLDLHADTGQAAVRAAGLYDRFAEVARFDGQELRGYDAVTAALVHHELPAEGTVSAPEIDRGQLRDLFRTSLEPGTIHWGHQVDAVVPHAGGTARIHFHDGTTRDADLVIGADGAWSRVRRAVSDTVPSYFTTLVETWLDDVDTRHPGLARLVGPGTMVAKARGLMLSGQRNSSGHVRVYLGLTDAPADWAERAGLDLADTAAVRAHLLALLDGWHDSLRDLVRRGDGGFLNRAVHILPVGHSWPHTPGVTLLGDAAHVMPPYGIGANLALLDGTDLATAIATHDDLDAAVRAYEAIMLPRATAAAQVCAEFTDRATDAIPDVDAVRRQFSERIAG